MSRACRRSSPPTPSWVKCSSRATPSSTKPSATSPSTNPPARSSAAPPWPSSGPTSLKSVLSRRHERQTSRPRYIKCSALVQWCIDYARRMQIRKLMSLTYEQRFFEKLGFKVVSKDSLPLKVWSDCVRCPKNDACDELAMGLELADVPLGKGVPSPAPPRAASASPSSNISKTNPSPFSPCLQSRVLPRAIPSRK